MSTRKDTTSLTLQDRVLLALSALVLQSERSGAITETDVTNAVDQWTVSDFTSVRDRQALEYMINDHLLDYLSEL